LLEPQALIGAAGHLLIVDVRVDRLAEVIGVDEPGNLDLSCPGITSTSRKQACRAIRQYSSISGISNGMAVTKNGPPSAPSWLPTWDEVILTTGSLLSVLAFS
jgi:hypothetical protein